MNKSTLAIAIAALLVGGVAVAAFQHMRQPETAAGATALVAGTAVFKGGPAKYAENIRALKGG